MKFTRKQGDGKDFPPFRYPPFRLSFSVAFSHNAIHGVLKLTKRHPSHIFKGVGQRKAEDVGVLGANRTRSSQKAGGLTVTAQSRGVSRLLSVPQRVISLSWKTSRKPPCSKNVSGKRFKNHSSFHDITSLKIKGLYPVPSPTPMFTIELV